MHTCVRSSLERISSHSTANSACAKFVCHTQGLLPPRHRVTALRGLNPPMQFLAPDSGPVGKRGPSVRSNWISKHMHATI
jgi:hypothetical protein